jgi:peroxin-12
VLCKSGDPVSSSKASTLASIASCCLLPYVRTKWVQKCDEWRTAFEDGSLDSSSGDPHRVRSYLVRSLPYVLAVSELGRLLGYLLFMSGRKETPSWAHQLMGIKLVCAAQNNVVKKRTFLDSALVFLGTALEFSALFVQFVDWWYSNSPMSSDASRRSALVAALAGKRVPSPPHDAVRCRGGGGGSYAGVCPICRRPWVVATALLSSGYVFCYACIADHLNNVDKRCPVSGSPADLAYLVRLYDT